MNKQQATFDDFFSECYLKYKEYIKNYIAIRICHPHEAEDLAQDVFVRLWEHRAFVNKDTVWSLGSNRIGSSRERTDKRIL